MTDPDEPTDFSCNLTNIPNYKRVCYVYIEHDPRNPLPPGWVDCGDGIISTMSPITAALIRAAYMIGLPDLNERTFLEWLYRTDAMFNAGVAYLIMPTTDGPRPMPFSPTDLRSHFGFTSTAPTLSNVAFDAHCRRAHEHHLASQLISFDSTPPDEESADSDDLIILPE